MQGMKTFLLMAVMTFILAVLGNLIGGRNGLILALGIAGVSNLLTYWFSDKMVLKAYKARPLDPDHEIHRMTSDLAGKAGLPVPKVYLINQSQPNAFATGRNPKHAVVAVTKGLVDGMSRHELSGVIGHELGHIHNRDMLIGTVAATMAGAISYLGYAVRFGSGRGRGGQGNSGLLIIVAMILAPLAAMLIRMAISRTREYKADEFGAKVSGNPDYLASALGKLESWSKKIPMRGNPASSHLFIVHPFSGKSMASLFSTHPNTQDRIRRLKKM